MLLVLKIMAKKRTNASKFKRVLFVNADDPKEKKVFLKRAPKYQMDYKFLNYSCKKTPLRGCGICHKMQKKTSFYRHACIAPFDDKVSYEAYLRLDREGKIPPNRNDGPIESWGTDNPGMRNGVVKGKQCKED